MKLSRCDGRRVRLTGPDGNVFDGVCERLSPDYCFHEYGREEEALIIDSWLFYKSQIRSLELPRADEPPVWMSRPLHRMALQHEPFRMIESGLKKIELRLYDEKRRKLRVGDVIRFADTTDETEVLFVTVEELCVYADFGALYRDLPLLDCGYTAVNVKSASPTDMDLYYTPEEQARWGVVGIRVSLL